MPQNSLLLCSDMQGPTISRPGPFNSHWGSMRRL